ncbi:MAG: S41 family peptidase [Candidatus Aminicenantes bacterium]|nr:S41 family peptidase [Candidatus Aminicenantes bacterium]
MIKWLFAPNMKADRTRLFVLIALVAAALFAILEGRFLPGGSQQRFYSTRPDDLLGIVMRYIRDSYVEERDPSLVVEGAYRGLVNSLDPLSSYLDPAAAARYLSRESALYETGLVVVKTYRVFPQVIAVREGSPAEKAGLRPGDALSGIDGRNPLSWSLLETNLALRDADARPVKLRVIRETDTFETTVERARLAPVPAELAPLGTGGVLVRVHRLAAPLADDVRAGLLQQLRGRKGPVVVDLRNCDTGEVEEARKFLGLFTSGAALGWFEKRAGIKEPFGWSKAPEFKDVPVVVWTNAGTIGPAEIVAGVLQEARQAKVVGRETPGLAAKQEIYPLQDDSVLLLTSGVFTLASGRKLWEMGLTPDVKVPAGEQGQAAYLKRTQTLFPSL